MKNNILSDNELHQLFKEDAANILPDAATQDRLEYTYLLKSNRYKTAQNSFLGIFTWLFSWSQLPLKATAILAVILLSLLHTTPVENQFLPSGQDTTFNVVPFLMDSSETRPFFSDTCFQTKEIIKTSNSTSPKGNIHNVKAEKIFSHLPALYKTSPIESPGPFSLFYLPVLRQLKTIDLDNKVRAEYRLLV